MNWRWMALALLLQVPQQAALQNATGSIEGMLVRSGTNEPLQDARVLLMKAGSSESARPAVTTVSDGKFSFRNLEAGSYRLAFASNGYVRQEFGQRIPFGKGNPIELAEGQAIRGVIVRMTPTGSVSGRIQDSDSNPLPGVTVQLMRDGYDEKGQQSLRSFGKARTNDLGEYRIYFVTPGRYYLSVGHVRENPGRNQVREPYVPAFYPDVRDPRGARLLEVTPGAEIRGIDVTLQRQERFFVVRGRVVDSSTGRPPENISGLDLRPADMIGDLGGYLQSDQPLYQNGTFEFRNVVPGKYWLSSLAYESLARDREDRIAARKDGRIAVEVSDSDIDGIEVMLQAGFTISGRLRQEDGGAASGLSFWNISTGGPPQGATLAPVSAAAPKGGDPDFSYLNDDGTFQVLNVAPGDYRFSIDWLRDQYIKEARFGGVDILNRPLRLTGSEAGTLEIVLSKNVGAVEGRVVNERLEAVPAAQVALVPVSNRERTNLFRAVTTDPNGRFEISKIVPGEYKLFAWEAIEPYAYFDPELLRRSDSKGISVQVSELSRQTVTVTAIP